MMDMASCVCVCEYVCVYMYTHDQEALEIPFLHWKNWARESLLYFLKKFKK